MQLVKEILWIHCWISITEIRISRICVSCNYTHWKMKTVFILFCLGGIYNRYTIAAIVNTLKVQNNELLTFHWYFFSFRKTMLSFRKIFLFIYWNNTGEVSNAESLQCWHCVHPFTQSIMNWLEIYCCMKIQSISNEYFSNKHLNLNYRWWKHIFSWMDSLVLINVFSFSFLLLIK